MKTGRAPASATSAATILLNASSAPASQPSSSAKDSGDACTAARLKTPAQCSGFGRFSAPMATRCPAASCTKARRSARRIRSGRAGDAVSPDSISRDSKAASSASEHSAEDFREIDSVTWCDGRGMHAASFELREERQRGSWVGFFPGHRMSGINPPAGESRCCGKPPGIRGRRTGSDLLQRCATGRAARGGWWRRG